VLGLGAGWNETEFRAFGIPFDHRIDRFEEAFAIISGLLRDGAIDFEGRYYSARDCELRPRGPTPGGPPLLIGSTGARMLAITVPHVAAWNAWYADTDNSPDGVAPLRERVDEACRAAGRDPDEVERTVAVLCRMTGGRGRLQGDSARKPPPALEGPPAHLAAELARYAGQGIAEVQLVLDPITEASIAELEPVLRALDGD
jgi:alkanesulfonate monooxygenase SsuD/methylene tetrahydromethanopterin reductase-like flavin-dependent oxidoreductase (luciferase family)